MKWTEEKDKVIAECILNNTVKYDAFTEAAERLGASKKAVEVRYYSKKKYIDDMCKNIVEEEALESREPWFVKLCNAISSMLNIQKYM